MSVKLARFILVVLVAWAALAGTVQAQVEVIAHWSFDAPSLTLGDNGRILTAADATGNHIATGVFNGDIALANLTSVPGRFGDAAMFTNGTGFQVTNNASFSFPQIFEIMGPQAGDFSVAAWVNTTDTTTTKAIIADWGNAPANTHRFTYWFAIHNSLPRGQIRWANTPPDDTGGIPVDVITSTVAAGNPTGVTTFADGAWHHITYVWEQGPGTMDFYIDGQHAQTTTTARDPAQRYVVLSDSAVGSIGRKSDSNNFMIGALDEIWILGDALSAEEVLALATQNSVIPDILQTSNLTGSGIWTNDANWDTPLHPNNGNGGLLYEVAIGNGQTTIQPAENIVIEGLVQSGGSIISQGSLTVQANAEWTGGTLNAAGGQVTFAGTTTISGSMPKSLSGQINNTGMMTWQQGPVEFLSLPDEATELHNSGTLDFVGDGPSFVAAPGSPLLVNEPTGLLRRIGGMSPATIDVPTLNGGRVEVQSGNLHFAQGITNTPTGTIAGIGVISGNVMSSGRVAPGFSPGILTIDGNFTQQPDGELEIEVGGLLPGDQHDQLIVTGVAQLSGRLNMPIIDVPGSPPLNANDEIVILAAEGVLGKFRSFAAPNFVNEYPNLAVAVLYGPNEVRLRFATPTFNSPVFPPPPVSNWSNPGIWLGGTPDSLDIVTLQNAGPPVRIDVIDDDAFAHQLSINGGMGTFTVGVKNGNSLSVTNAVTIGQQGVVELGDPMNSGGGHLVSTAITIQAGGRLTGDGTVHGILNVGMSPSTMGEAVVSPGFGSGHLEIQGSYNQGPSGTLLMDVGSPAVGAFDTINISGDAALGGKLVFDASNFVGDAGDSFQFLAAGSFDPGANFENFFDDVETIGSNSIYIAVGVNEIATGSNLGTGSLATGTSFDGFACNLGDMNCDNEYDDIDVERFALALVNPDEFELQTLLDVGLFIQGNIAGDVDGFGGFDFDDIDDFVDLLTESGSGATVTTVLDAIARLQNPVPEPASLGLIVLGVVIVPMIRVRRKAGSR